MKLKRKSSADCVGEAQSDLAWQRQISSTSSKNSMNSQVAPLCGYVSDKSGIIAKFLRSRFEQSEVSYG